MPNWKKLVVSGSDARLASLFTTSHITGSGHISGSSTSTGSFGTVHTVGNVSGSSTSTGSFGYGQIDTKLAIGTTNLPYGPFETYSESGFAKQHFRLFPSDGLSGVQTNLGSYFQIKGGTAATLVIDTGTDQDAGIEFKESGSFGPYITAQHNFSLFDIGTRNGYDIRLKPDSGIVDFDDNSIKDLLHLSASGNISGSSTSTGSFGTVQATYDINTTSGRVYEQGNSVIDHATAMAIVFGG